MRTRRGFSSSCKGRSQTAPVRKRRNEDTDLELRVNGRGSRRLRQRGRRLDRLAGELDVVAASDDVLEHRPNHLRRRRLFHRTELAVELLVDLRLDRAKLVLQAAAAREELADLLVDAAELRDLLVRPLEELNGRGDVPGRVLARHAGFLSDARPRLPWPVARNVLDPHCRPKT